MNKQRKRNSLVIFTLSIFVAGTGAGFALKGWEDGVAQRASQVFSEEKYMDAELEELNCINQYWNSKPEIARALLERSLRSDERLLQSVKGSRHRSGLFSEGTININMALMHVKLAFLCQKLGDSNSVTEHVAKATELMKCPSDQVYAAMAKLDATNTASGQASQ